jgi:hypothetical protein
VLAWPAEPGCDEQRAGPLPGAVHNLTAARIWGILRELAAVGRGVGCGGARN